MIDLVALGALRAVIAKRRQGVIAVEIPPDWQRPLVEWYRTLGSTDEEREAALRAIMRALLADHPGGQEPTPNG